MADKRIMTEFKLEEVSFVKKPAQRPAVAQIMKSEDLDWMSDDELMQEDTAQTVSLQLVNKSLVDMATGEEAGHQHGIRVEHYENGKAHVYLGYAGEEEGGQHSHDVVMNADGSITVTENFGHSHTIDSAELQRLMMAVLTKVDIEFPEEAEIADLLKAWDQSGDVVLEKDANMADNDTKAADDLKAAQEALAKAESERDEALAKAGMNDAEKQFMAKLDKDAAKAFAGMDRKARMAEMRKSEDEDPVVYKSEISGDEFRKSDDPRLVEMAKRDDVREAELKKMRQDSEDAAFKKTAEDDFANVPGDVEVRVALAKAIAKSGETDEMQGKMLAALKAHSGEMGKTTTTFGRQGINKADEGGAFQKRDEASDELDRIAKELREADPKLSDMDAYEKACEQNPALYETAISGAY
ncbi:MAG: hypothetical protein AAFX78_02515 [Cyanobacteria bacterium J06638_20]